MTDEPPASIRRREFLRNLGLSTVFLGTLGTVDLLTDPETAKLPKALFARKQIPDLQDFSLLLTDEQKKQLWRTHFVDWPPVSREHALNFERAKPFIYVMWDLALFFFHAEKNTAPNAPMPSPFEYAQEFIRKWHNFSDDMGSDFITQLAIGYINNNNTESLTGYNKDVSQSTKQVAASALIHHLDRFLLLEGAGLDKFKAFVTRYGRGEENPNIFRVASLFNPTIGLADMEINELSRAVIYHAGEDNINRFCERNPQYTNAISCMRAVTEKLQAIDAQRQKIREATENLLMVCPNLFEDFFDPNTCREYFFKLGLKEPLGDFHFTNYTRAWKYVSDYSYFESSHLHKLHGHQAIESTIHEYIDEYNQNPKTATRNLIRDNCMNPAFSEVLQGSVMRAKQKSLEGASTVESAADILQKAIKAIKDLETEFRIASLDAYMEMSRLDLDPHFQLFTSTAYARMLEETVKKANLFENIPLKEQDAVFFNAFASCCIRETGSREVLAERTDWPTLTCVDSPYNYADELASLKTIFNGFSKNGFFKKSSDFNRFYYTLISLGKDWFQTQEIKTPSVSIQHPEIYSYLWSPINRFTKLLEIFSRQALFEKMAGSPEVPAYAPVSSNPISRLLTRQRKPQLPADRHLFIAQNIQGPMQPLRFGSSLFLTQAFSKNSKDYLAMRLPSVGKNHLVEEDKGNYLFIKLHMTASDCAWYQLKNGSLAMESIDGSLVIPPIDLSQYRGVKVELISQDENSYSATVDGLVNVHSIAQAHRLADKELCDRNAQKGSDILSKNSVYNRGRAGLLDNATVSRLAKADHAEYSLWSKNL